jgi:hypothetical protein
MSRPVDPIVSNSIVYLATSVEAIAARLRDAAHEPEGWRVLEWAAEELDRLGGEAKSIADDERVDETQQAAQ